METNKTELETKGFTIFPAFFDEQYMLETSRSMDRSYELCRSIQVKNGIAEVTDGTVHHLVVDHNEPIYLDILARLCNSPMYDFIKAYFGGNFILNTYGGVINLPSKPSYVANIHRDIRFFSGDFPLMLNFLIMLDDFTLENGATYLLPGSHKQPNKPGDEEFYANSYRVVGKRGDILFFNSNLWHAAGLNKSTAERRAITVNFSKPFMKQQMDYPRAIGYEKVEKMSNEMKQMLGYFSRVPGNLDEWYQKPENRFYRPGQD
jgi:hypothetical protein